MSAYERYKAQNSILTKLGYSRKERKSYYDKRLAEVEAQIKEEEEKFSPDNSLLEELKVKRLNLFFMAMLNK